MGLLDDAERDLREKQSAATRLETWHQRSGASQRLQPLDLGSEYLEVIHDLVARIPGTTSWVGEGPDGHMYGIHRHSESGGDSGLLERARRWVIVLGYGDYGTPEVLEIHKMESGALWSFYDNVYRVPSSPTDFARAAASAVLAYEAEQPQPPAPAENKKRWWQS